MKSISSDITFQDLFDSLRLSVQEITRYQVYCCRVILWHLLSFGVNHDCNAVTGQSNYRMDKTCKSTITDITAMARHTDTAMVSFIRKDIYQSGNARDRAMARS